jgi:hypothetical protein
VGTEATVDSRGCSIIYVRLRGRRIVVLFEAWIR